jgi:hypothetical protein
MHPFIRFNRFSTVFWGEEVSTVKITSNEFIIVFFAVADDSEVPVVVTFLSNSAQFWYKGAPNQTKEHGG